MAKKYIVQDVFIGAGGSYPFVTFDSLKNNYEKIILSMDRSYITSYNGIKALNLMDWLLA